jgi:mono/diheme cytochrome c family protein
MAFRTSTWLFLSALPLNLCFGASDAAVRAAAILQARCFGCHGEQTSMSGLRLTSRQAALTGGSRGPAITPGNAETSLLWRAVTQSATPSMPPGGKLTDAELASLRTWINEGAAWPETSVTGAAASRWWAFQKPARVAAPVGLSIHPIDAFIAAKLTASGLSPAPQADRLTLIKRATYDLHGLPPTPEMVREFLSDQRPDAWERLIDRLLESPHYGEKWGRHWLDLVRYGDTSGFEQDPYSLGSWRYRDWVIRSLNADKPYDRFVKEQIAGDELWPDDADARSGTGYFRVGPNRDMLFKVDDINRVEKLTDYVDTTSGVFLGLTVGCARCHDHKFDPIPQRDYYRMQAIFAPLVYDQVPLDYNPSRVEALAENTRTFKLWQISDTIERLYRPYRERIRESRMAPLSDEAKQALRLPEDKRTAAQQALFTRYDAQVKPGEDEIRAAMSEGDRERLHEVEKKLVSMYAAYGPPTTSPGVTDVGREAPKTFLAPRGNWQNPGEEVQPGFLSVLGGGDTPAPPLHASTTWRRKALAEWIASPENPLFARVMVNRVWQFHFGQGLLRTPSDFGTRAGQPSHPELLDWLAQEFVARKWSLKAMHRLIMTSETYRRSANASKEAREKDPNNLLLSFMSRRRLSSEELRDAALQSAGALNAKMGGIPVVPPLDQEELYGITGKSESSWYVTVNAAEHNRRSIYLLVRRNFRQPMFEAFDAPDGVLSCARRSESTTATQSLTMLNGRFVMETAKAFGTSLESVDEAWLRVFGRAPGDGEKREAEAFLERQRQRTGSKAGAFAELVRAMWNSNEFLYVD